MALHSLVSRKERCLCSLGAGPQESQEGSMSAQNTEARGECRCYPLRNSAPTEKKHVLTSTEIAICFDARAI